MRPEEDHSTRSKLPLSLLVCLGATVAIVGSARFWEAATGLSHWVWLACGIMPLLAGALVHWKMRRPVDFLGSRPDPEGVRRPGLGGLLSALVLFLVPRLVGDGAAAVAATSGAHTVVVAATATAVSFAVVVLCYKVAETALNRRDAALAASQGNP